ncbi:peroxiredoxin [Actinomycetes bacterium]|nr:peroxiredoxin [Actinomycetes bacterium]
MAIEPGSKAPEFTLSNQFGEKVSLADYQGKKNVVLMFYPFAFSGTCTGELCALRDQYTDFVNDDTVVLSVSCDSPYTLKAFAEHDQLTHPLLSDFWPHGDVSKAYGVFLDEKGFATRGTFVIDKDGMVRWSVVNGPGEARNSDEYKAALAAL